MDHRGPEWTIPTRRGFVQAIMGSPALLRRKAGNLLTGREVDHRAAMGDYKDAGRSSPPPQKPKLLAVDAEVIVEYRHCTVGCDRDMHRFMHQKVVSWPLADDPEVVYASEVRLAVLQRDIEALLGSSSSLILEASRLPRAIHPLRLEVESATYLVAIDGGSYHRVQWTFQ